MSPGRFQPACDGVLGEDIEIPCHPEGALFATEGSLTAGVEILTALHPQCGACVAIAQDDILRGNIFRR